MIHEDGYLVPIPEQTRIWEGITAGLHRLKVSARMPHQALQSTGKERKIGPDTTGSLTGHIHAVRNPVDRAHPTPRFREISLWFCTEIAVWAKVTRLRVERVCTEPQATHYAITIGNHRIFLRLPTDRRRVAILGVIRQRFATLIGTTSAPSRSWSR